MAKKNGKRYRAKLNVELVLEALQRGGADAEVARTHGVHPVRSRSGRRSSWTRGPRSPAGSAEVVEYERRVGDLERIVGQKEVEIALLRNSLDGL